MDIAISIHKLRLVDESMILSEKYITHNLLFYNIRARKDTKSAILTCSASQVSW